MIPAVMPTYARADVAFERGEGVFLFDADGTRYLDFASGVAVSSLGHAHPKLVGAIAEQAAKVMHVSNLFRVTGQERLAERLTDLTFADTVFFTNSGAEAMECAIKTARKYQDAVGQPQKTRIICAEGSFHGRTIATISAAGAEKLTKGFGPMLEGFDHVPWGNLNELRAAITPETGAVIMEPVQGEGGVRLADEDFFKGLRAACDEFGLLLIFDEVQSGAGRTGALFAHQKYGVTPDIMAAAKGLGGGFPMGACLASEEAAKGMVAGTHGSTYGGNPLAMAAANAVLDVLTEPGFLDQVSKTAASFGAGLDSLIEKHPSIVKEWRGEGLLMGLICEKPNAEVITACRAQGLLSAPAGENVMRLLPPLIVTEQEIDLALEAMDKAFSAL